MKATELISMDKVTTLEVNFKDPRLQEATSRIFEIYKEAVQYVDLRNREIAKILGDVAEQKSYVADGFKSVADYAYQTFGIARQNAYALANAGKVYNNPEALPELKEFSPSKISELANVPTPILSRAIQSGEISPDTTQKDLRKFASENKVNTREPKIVDERYYVHVVGPYQLEEIFDFCKLPRTLEDIDSYFVNYIFDNVETVMTNSEIDVIELPRRKKRGDKSRGSVIRRLYICQFLSIAIELTKVDSYNLDLPDSAPSEEDIREMLESEESSESESPSDSDSTETA